MNMTSRRLLWLLASVACYAALVGVWQLIADARLVASIYLPGPDRVLAALRRGAQSGELIGMIAITARHMLFGWLLASLAGVALGALIGISPAARAYFGPLLEFLRPLPASAVFPVAIALMGLSGGMLLSVIAFGALWPMLIATVHGFSSVEPRLIEVGAALKLSRWQLLRKIALPNAMPDILAGMRFGLTIALILAVVGEMLVSQGGLGHWILLSARMFRSADLFAGVFVLGLIGLAGSALLNLIERRVLAWRA